MFGNHGLCGLPEEGAHEKSPKCLGGNLGDFGEFCKGLEPWVYVSSGIGPFLGQEFFIVSPFETPEHIETLAMLASASMHYPDQFQLGKTVNIGRPWVEQSSFQHFLISLPYPYGQELEYMDNVRFFWLLPITHQERLFLDTHSVEDLETRFDEVGIDYLDINRASTI